MTTITKNTNISENQQSGFLPTSNSSTNPVTSIAQSCMQASSANSVLSSSFANWKKDGIPIFSASIGKLTVKPCLTSLIDVETQTLNCLEKYKEANLVLEKTIGDVALLYVYKDGDPTTNTPGPLLEFSQKLSRRYLDLYQAYIEFEMQQNIPMIPIKPGQMKQHGFTSQEIISLQTPAKKFRELRQQIPSDQLDIFLSSLIHPDAKKNPPSSLISLILQYDQLPKRDLLDKALMLMTKFGFMSIESAIELLDEIADMKVLNGAEAQIRLQMELRHRVCNFSNSPSKSPGSIGTNPLAYINVIKHGEHNNPEGEFREQLYFVYMSNHFANAIMQSPEFIKFASEKFEWINQYFINAMNAREPKYLPHIFRYVMNASINAKLRIANVTDQARSDYYKRHPLPKIKQLLNDSTPLEINFRYHLTPRELLNQTGEISPQHIPDDATTQYTTGAVAFNLKTLDEIPASEIPARQYLQIVNDLLIPTVSGISGTLDQSTTMAGLVGIGIEKNQETELELIKLAYLAFMLPNQDHSVHEILQSSTSFGNQQYLAGPGYERFIYPSGGQPFIDKIKSRQLQRGWSMPIEYLSTPSS